jgi:hypothetical protein
VLEEAPAVHEEEGQKNKILEETLNPKAPSMNSTTFFHRFKNWGDIICKTNKASGDKWKECVDDGEQDTCHRHQTKWFVEGGKE